MKKVFRKLHLWLSVPFGLFIALICFSGAMLVFEKELSERIRSDLYFVEKVGERPLPLDELMTTVAASLPDSVSLTSVAVDSDPERTCRVGLSLSRHASLYVDPYTGKVLGRNERLPFYDAMIRLHRRMMGDAAGNGKLLVGISTLALVLILITGLALWLAGRRPLAKSLRICCTGGWPRFWHDLHVAGGIYTALFLLVLALTGLTWSFPWYRTGFYRAFGTEAPVRGGRAGGDSSARSSDRPVQLRSSYAHWQEIYDRLATEYPDARRITVSDGWANVVPAGRISFRSVDRFDFDRQSGRITGRKPYGEQNRANRLRNGVYTVHIGTWGGIVTRILTFLAALLGATLPLTGYYLWIRRLVKGGSHRPKGDRPL